MISYCNIYLTLMKYQYINIKEITYIKCNAYFTHIVGVGVQYLDYDQLLFAKNELKTDSCLIYTM
jgi:hypothetical protein